MMGVFKRSWLGDGEEDTFRTERHLRYTIFYVGLGVRFIGDFEVFLCFSFVTFSQNNIFLFILKIRACGLLFSFISFSLPSTVFLCTTLTLFNSFCLGISWGFVLDRTIIMALGGSYVGMTGITIQCFCLMKRRLWIIARLSFCIHLLSVGRVFSHLDIMRFFY